MKPLLLVAISDLAELNDVLDQMGTRQPMIDAVGAESGAKALELADHYAPDALLVDSTLSDMPGVDLLTTLRKRLPQLTAVILSDGVSDIQRAGLDPGETVCLEKPIAASSVARKVGSMLLSDRAGFHGVIDSLELPELLQLLCFRSATTQLHISSSGGEGDIYIQGGEIIHAELNGVKGEEAFYFLFSWKGGVFERVDTAVMPERTIQLTWQALLLEASRVIDESPDKYGPLKAPQPIRKRTTVPSPYRKPIDAPKPHRAGETAPGASPPKPAASAPKVVIDSGALLEHQAAVEAAARAKTQPPPPPPVREAVKVRKAGPEQASTPPPAARRGKRKRPSFDWIMTFQVALIIAAPAGLFWGWHHTNRDLGWGKFSSIDPPPPHSGESVVTVVEDDGFPEPVVPEVVPLDGEGLCSVEIVHLDRFSDSGITVGIDQETFDRLNLAANPWVMLVGLEEARIGAYAVLHQGEPDRIYLRKSMAQSLKVIGEPSSQVLVQPIQWVHREMVDASREFVSPRRLPAQYCDDWYVVGVSLQVMEETGLFPGAYALARGPAGFQSVTVQMMDRGSTNDIWLSKSVRDAICGTPPGSGRITLYPKNRTPAN